MSWLNTEEIFALIDLVDSGRGSCKEKASKVLDSPLSKMFTQFRVHASEAKECLLAAISRREDLSGLSKDCTELIVGQDQGEKARVEGLSGSNCEKRIKDKIFSHLKSEDVPSRSSVL